MFNFGLIKKTVNMKFLFTIISLITPVLFYSQIDTNKIVIYPDGDTTAPDKAGDYSDYIITYKNFHKTSSVEIFAGEYYISYARIFGAQIGLEMSLGGTFSTPDLFVPKRESFADLDPFYSRPRIGYIARLEIQYFLKDQNATGAYAGLHYEKKKFNYSLLRKVSGTSSDNTESRLKSIQYNEYNIGRLKLGYVYNFGSSPMQITYALDISFGLGMAYVNTVRNNEIETYDNIDNVYNFEYPEISNKFFRLSPYLSLKASRGF
ncbi:MAG: hypothetical protein ACI9N1_003028 [Flavobacteriales bacterium]|jgi:hypothetical protein